MKLSEQFALQTYLDGYNPDRDFYGVLEDLEDYNGLIQVWDAFRDYPNKLLIDWIVTTQLGLEELIKASGGVDKEV